MEKRWMTPAEAELGSCAVHFPHGVAFWSENWNRKDPQDPWRVSVVDPEIRKRRSLKFFSEEGRRLPTLHLVGEAF